MENYQRYLNGEDVDISSIIDMESGLKRVVNNKQLYVRLLNNSKLQEMYDKLVEAINGGDNNAGSAAAHTMKGVAANLSMMAVYNIVIELEVIIKKGEKDGELVESLGKAVEATIKVISNI